MNCGNSSNDVLLKKWPTSVTLGSLTNFLFIKYSSWKIQYMLPKSDPKDNNIKIIETIPYESENKYSAVFYEIDGEVYCTVKGSLEVVKSFSNKINLKNDILWMKWR